MSDLVRVLDATTSTGLDLGTSMILWCPGCNDSHRIIVRAGDRSTPIWRWNEDHDKPTIHPSILVNGRGSARTDIPRCHSWIRDGKWVFLKDSTHHLAGQIVDMMALPDHFQEDIPSQRESV